MAPSVSIVDIEDSCRFHNRCRDYEFSTVNGNHQQTLYNSPVQGQLEHIGGEIAPVQSMKGTQQYFLPLPLINAIDSTFNPVYGQSYCNQIQEQRRQSEQQQVPIRIEGSHGHPPHLKHASMTSNSNSYIGWEITPGASPQLDLNQYYNALLGANCKVPHVGDVSDLNIPKFPYRRANLVAQPERQPEHLNETKRRVSKTGLSSTSRSYSTRGSSSSQCVDCFKDLGAFSEEFKQFGLKRGKGGDMCRDVKSQNEFLLERLFDDKGECEYHARCILKTFKISKGRLSRLKEKKKRIIKGIVNAKHGLCGRPSNNRKSFETLNQFVDFILFSRGKCSSIEGVGNRQQYRMLPSFKRVQGDGPESVRGQFNLFQQRHDPSGKVRQTLSNGTIQAWFNKYFADSTCLSGLSTSSLTSNFCLGSDFKVSDVEKCAGEEKFVIDSPGEIEATKKELLGDRYRDCAKYRQLSENSVESTLYGDISCHSVSSGRNSINSVSSGRNSINSEDLIVFEEEEDEIKPDTSCQLTTNSPIIFTRFSLTHKPQPLLARASLSKLKTSGVSWKDNKRSQKNAQPTLREHKKNLYNNGRWFEYQSSKGAHAVTLLKNISNMYSKEASKLQNVEAKVPKPAKEGSDKRAKQ